MAASTADAGSGEPLEGAFPWDPQNQLPILSDFFYFGVLGSGNQEKLERFSLDDVAPIVLHDMPDEPFGTRVTNGGIFWTNQVAEVSYRPLRVRAERNRRRRAVYPLGRLSDERNVEGSQMSCFET
jgi:hypothetical protein